MEKSNIELCSDFSNGTCKIIGCSHDHVKCKTGIICTNKSCKYGHPLSLDRRVMIRSLYEDLRSKDREYKKGAEFCKYNMTCINPDCEFLHPFGFESRQEMRKLYTSLNKEQHNENYDITKKDVSTMTDPIIIENTTYNMTKPTIDIRTPIMTNHIIEKKEMNIKKDSLCYDFSIGNCDKKDCTQKHIKCKYGIICRNNECKFGHPLPYDGRIIIRDMYEEFRLENKEYKKDADYCEYNMLCYDENCPHIHPFSYNYRKQIRDTYIMIKTGTSPNETTPSVTTASTVPSSPFIDNITDFPEISPLITPKKKNVVKINQIIEEENKVQENKVVPDKKKKKEEDFSMIEEVEESKVSFKDKLLGNK